MTTRERVIVTAVVIGLAAGAVLLYVLSGGGDESGIRVKNGSMLISTESNMGFEKAGTEWASKLKLKKGCFDIYVTTTPACDTPVLPYSTWVRFRDGTGDWHVMGIIGNKFRGVLKGTWDPQGSSGKTLKHNNGVLRISRIEAVNMKGESLACEFGIDDPTNLDELRLDAGNANCTP